jgi:gamma-glutamyl:cysteine ligase YbdK (ATP-grasp superfamily)
LIDFCKPVAHDIGESKSLELVRQTLIDKPGYSHQLGAYAKSHSTHAVVEKLKSQLILQLEQTRESPIDPTDKPDQPAIFPSPSI